jgi:hypothetical protein
MSQSSGEVYHGEFEIPLFNLKYHVLLSPQDIMLTSRTANVIFEGLNLELKNKPGYAGVVEHDKLGTHFILCLDIGFYDANKHELRNKNVSNISKYAVSLAWSILEELEIDVDVDNHVIQCELVERIVDDVLGFLEEISEDAPDENNSSDDSFDEL